MAQLVLFILSIPVLTLTAKGPNKNKKKTTELPVILLDRNILERHNILSSHFDGR